MTTTAMREILASVAPGTQLRDGLERILRGRTGAIVVIGGESDDSLFSGGFELDVEFSPSRLRELAKMDGAVVLEAETYRIKRANVQLLPNPAIATTETGMRHRTAQRVSVQLGTPVISVSQSMHVIALYIDGVRHVLESSDDLIAKANQALATLERYQARLSEILSSLTTLEIEDLVTARDVAEVVRRVEMVYRIWQEIDGYVVELGTDGRLAQLQLIELVSGVARDRELILADYSNSDADAIRQRVSQLDAEALASPMDVARAVRLPLGSQGLDTPLSPRGYRMLSRIPRLPYMVSEAIVDHMGSLQHLLGSTTEELQQVEGIGPLRARTIREGLSRLAERAITDRGF